MTARSVRVGVLLAALSACTSPIARPAPPLGVPHLTHGVAVGEVGARSAVVWGRCDGPAALHVVLDGGATPRAVAVGAAHDFTGKVVLDKLSAGTAYRFRAWCGDSANGTVEGAFRTAPDPRAFAPVRMLWGGDVGGQNVCRDAAAGYPIFDRMLARRPDFFVALGDMVYADDACLAVGRFGNTQVPGPPPARATVPAFWEHWRYDRADAAMQRFLAAAPYYAVWDDHETQNDAGPRNQTLPDAPAAPRLAPARAAFVDYQPLVDAERLYRSARWGRHLEVFFLDTRSYRDGNTDLDIGTQPKTMLGMAQLRWLIDGLVRSHATWKVVVSSVPLSIPTGGDGWADGGTGQGFERELLAILKLLRMAHVRNLVWLTTDVHFATGFRSTPLPGLRMLELTSGPLSAMFFPHRDVDPTLRPERLYFHGPSVPVTSAEEAQRWSNFGELDVGAFGGLTVRIITAENAVVFEREFRPE